MRAGEAGKQVLWNGLSGVARSNDDNEEFQYLAVDRAVHRDDFLAPASVRQEQRFLQPGLVG